MRESLQSRRARARSLIRHLERAYPDATIALRFTTPVELLVATILAAQCTDERVNQVTASLFQKYRRAEDYARADPATFEGEIRSTGFFRAKTRSVLGMARALVERHGGEVPRTLETLTALPGVGRKTANVVLGNAYGVPGIAVDTHVFRVSNRTGLAPGKDPLEVEARLMKVTPKKYLRNAHHYLILHGRYTCVAKKPLCWKCPVYEQCEFREKKKFAAMGPDAAPKPSVLPKGASPSRKRKAG